MATIGNMNSININGSTFYGGRNITINNGRVIIDGKDLTPDAKNISIQVNGDVHEMSVDACNQVDIHGSVGQISTLSGDVICHAVSGDVNTMSGDVRCQNVGGSVKTMSGDISRS